MKIFIPLLIVGIFSSIFSGVFLSFYYRLVRTANKATGKIISFDRSNFILFQDILVPVVRFKTQDDSWIESKPEYSFFHELNKFVLHDNVTVYYQADNPENFVIESKTEVIFNQLVIILTFSSLVVWLLLS